MSQSNEQDFYARYLSPPAGGERGEAEAMDDPVGQEYPSDGGDARTGGGAQGAPEGEHNGHRRPDSPPATPQDGAPAAQQFPPRTPPGPSMDRHDAPVRPYPPSAHQQYPPMDRPPRPDAGAGEPRGQYPPTDQPGEDPRPHYRPTRPGPPAAGGAARGDNPAADSEGRHRPGPAPARGVPSSSVGPMRAQVRQADLVRPYKPIPEIGWRKKLHQITRINPGVGPAEREWIDLKRRLGVNLRGTYLVAVMQQKGGASKTTSTIGLGEALSRYRDDKVVAIDANPANGNLASRVDEPSTGTWRSLIADPNLLAYSDFRHYLGKDTSCGLEVLGSDIGDDVMTGIDLIRAWDTLSRMYPIGLIDCGNQMRDDLTAAILSRVDAVVVVSTTRFDGAVGAQDTLNWLISHGYPHLVRSAVMIISNVNKVTADKAVRNLHEDFERVCRAVHDIPFDPHLSDATAINFDRLAPATRRAFLEAAASVVDGFAGAADKDSGYRDRGDWR